MKGKWSFYMSQRKFSRAKQKLKKSQNKDLPNNNQQPSLQAMVWYREEHWESLKSIFADGDNLPKTYQDWLARAEEMQAQIQASGDAVVKVFIDPETFPKWCEEKGLPMDGEARSQLAIEVAQAKSFSL